MSNILLGYNDVKKQSLAVYGQFGESKWKPYARMNAARIETGRRLDAERLRNSGVGRVAVLAGMGASLESAIPVLKEYRERFDLIACDKAAGILFDHGIRPDYVFLADCNIEFRWAKDWIHKTRDVTLLATCYANPDWTHSWQGPVCFYVNRDAIKTERVFEPIMGKGVRTIPAASNVSNAMLVFWTGCDDKSAYNWGGYERYLLTGFDYSWRPDGNYYAFSDPAPKKFYMHHRTMIDMTGERVFTSENLLFSAKWLYSYISVYDLPIMNCSGRGLLDIPYKGDLRDQLARVNPDPRARKRVLEHFESVKAARKAYELARRSFDSIREGLWL